MSATVDARVYEDRTTSSPEEIVVSLVIPARDEAHHLGGCLAAIAAQDVPLAWLEVIVIDGASSDGSAEIARAELSRYGFGAGRVIANPSGSTPNGLNIGLASATGAYLCRVDARSMIPIDYVRRCIEVLDADASIHVTGGRQVTVSRGSSTRDVGIARALNNRWAMGSSRYRRRAGSGRTDTVYLGFFRTAEVRAVNGWDPVLATNQDFDLNQRLGGVFFDSRLNVRYVPRESFGQLFAQYHRFGRWKVRYWRYRGTPPSARQWALLLAPPLVAAAGVGALRRARGVSRLMALGAAAAGALAVEHSGTDQPAGSLSDRAASVAASGVVAAGWLSGVARGLAQPEPPLGATGVTYVASRWGEPTQTFVRREAEALAAAGIPVRALSLKSPRRVDGTVQADRESRHERLVGVLKASGRHPVRVARVVATVLARSSARNLAPTLAAAVVGVSWAGNGKVRNHLHSHFGWVSGTAAWAAASTAGVSHSVVLHAFELHRPDLQDRFTSVPLRSAQPVVVAHDRDIDLVRDRYGALVEVVRMGVPDRWFELPRRPEPDLVVAVGSLVPKKGHDVLIKAVAQARHRWRVVIVGEGPERARLESLIADHDLADRVRLAGLLDEDSVAELTTRATVACLACRVAPDGDRDGLPSALLEAMAAGVPVVSTRVSGIPELLSGVGLLVDPEDPAALARALDLLSEPARADSLGALGRRRVRERHRSADQATRLATVLGC